MWKISLEKQGETITQWIFNVKVTQDRKSHNYTVALEKKYYKELTQRNIPPIVLIERSFLFLLDREPPSSILKEFNLKEITGYFPEYEEEMKKRL